MVQLLALPLCSYLYNLTYGQAQRSRAAKRFKALKVQAGLKFSAVGGESFIWAVRLMKNVFYSVISL